jgi:hypothetical protein
MIVSNFELLVKRIAPKTGTASIDAAFRRVVQGYFLQITNLNPARTSSFFMRFTIAALPVGSPLLPINREMVIGPDKSPTANVACYFDVAGLENDFKILFAKPTLTTTDHKVFDSASFSIAPLQTVSFTLLPNLTYNGDLIKNEAMEVRGMVELFQTGSYFLFPQRAAIEVLVTPEIRGTFLDNDFAKMGLPASNELDFDQINYGLPLASGKAQNTVEAGERLVLTPFPLGSGVKISSEIMEQMNEELAAMNLVVKKKTA